jgi:trigger factor
MFADVRRGLTIAAVVHGATVTDSEGNEVDTAEFFGPSNAEQPVELATDDAEADADGDVADDDADEAADDSK